MVRVTAYHRLFITLALLLAGMAPAQPAERRVALVIGNGQYHYVPRLDNPTHDARLIAETLTAVGFTLVGGHAQLDLDKTAFDRVVQEFGTVIQGVEVALFYYAGHGLQVRGGNYLVPVRANPVREAEIDFQLLNVDLVLRQMEFARTQLNLVILDACRNNPFAGRGLRAAGGGLAQMQAPEGTLIAYATQPGNVAQDGTDGHSPYTRALARAFRQPGLDVFAVFNATGLEVKQRTGGAQQPWVSLSPIAGQFYFAGAPDQPPPRPPAVPATGSQGAAAVGAPPSPSPPAADPPQAATAVELPKQAPSVDNASSAPGAMPVFEPAQGSSLMKAGPEPPEAYCVYDASGQKQLGCSVIGYSIQLFPGTYQVDLNNTRQSVTVQANQRTIVASGALVVAGGGPPEPYCVYDASGQKQLSCRFTGYGIQLFPGTYQVELHNTRVPVHVRAKEKTTL